MENEFSKDVSALEYNIESSIFKLMTRNYFNQSISKLSVDFTNSFMNANGHQFSFTFAATLSPSLPKMTIALR